MQTFYKRFSVITGFGILLAILVVNTFVIRRQLKIQVENQAWMYHTQLVLQQATLVQSLITDAETGQRGYLYTHDSSYLEPYKRAVSQIDSQIQALRDLTTDNPQQETRVTHLDDLVQQKLDELSDTLALADAGNPDAARALVLSNRGQHTMENIRALSLQVQQEETSLAARRTESYGKSVRVTIVCIYLTSVLAVVGLVLLAYFVLRDIDVREEHAAELQEREQWFRVTLTSIGDGVIATDERGMVTFVNPVAERLTGRTAAQAKAKPISEIFPIYNEVTRKPVENPVAKVMEFGNVVGLANHTVLERPDGTLTPIEDSAAPIRDDAGRLAGVVLVFRDATAERSSQDLVRKTEKIAAAARLAATIAHEINNPLEAVSNLIYLARAREGVPEDALNDLKIAEEELARVSHVTRQTLGFYREATLPDVCDFSVLIETVLRLYSNKLQNKNISVNQELSPCPPLQGWAGELQQVVSNLVSNAIDAMGDNGALKVGVSSIETPGGPAVQLLVEDNGPGIDAQNLERVFEPFFTTKKDVGTGLGLYVSKQIVERHGGTIEVQSNNHGSSGTAFRVVLPCAAGEVLHNVESA